MTIRRSLLAGSLLVVAAACLPQKANAIQAGLTPCSKNTITATGTSSNIKLSTCGSVVLVWNIGANEAFYNYGSSSGTTASASDYSIPSGQFVVLNLGTSGLYLAGYSSSGSTLRITQGQAQ